MQADAYFVQSDAYGNLYRLTLVLCRLTRILYRLTRLLYRLTRILYRRRYLADRRRVVLVQGAVRRWAARKQLKKLKIEAKSVEHQRQLNKGEAFSFCPPVI